MKIPLSWLKEFITINQSPEEIADLLTSAGIEVDGIESQSEDFIFEISLTPNLVHCASVRGIARELSALIKTPIHNLTASSRGNQPSLHEQTLVTIENPAACPRYACKIISGVCIGPSPDWLKKKLEQCGMRPVNNVVDITNFVMLELGHPLHAFDFDTLEEKRIVVRNPKKEETLVMLNERELYPLDDTLLICDAKRPIALAGIMGCKHTEVTDQTKNIVLESAYFAPSIIRNASKKLGVHSDASYRFERGTDPNGIVEALERAAALICEIAKGDASGGTIDIGKREFENASVSCRLSRVGRILGIRLAMGEIETIFRLLDFKIVSVQDDVITVTVPTYRQDIYQEIDLIEEVARIYGYQNIHQGQKAFFRTGALPHCEEYLFEKKIRSFCISEGLQELITCDLISPFQAELIDKACFPTRNLIKLLNPRSVEQSVMRPTLLPGLLDVVKYNSDHNINSISAFEIGRVHFTSKEKYLEPTVASFLISGTKAEHHWESKTADVDFFDLKGLIENLLQSLKIKSATFSKSHFANFHPGRQATILIGEVEIGIMGEVHPATLKKAGLEQPIYFAELNLEDIKRFVPLSIKMQGLPQYPASSRDWTLTLNEAIDAGKILESIKNISSNLLESVSLLDVYRSDKLGLDKKNLTFRFIYRDLSKTISDAEVESEHARIIKTIALIVD